MNLDRLRWAIGALVAVGTVAMGACGSEPQAATQVADTISAPITSEASPTVTTTATNPTVAAVDGIPASPIRCDDSGRENTYEFPAPQSIEELLQTSDTVVIARVTQVDDTVASPILIEEGGTVAPLTNPDGIPEPGIWRTFVHSEVTQVVIGDNIQPGDKIMRTETGGQIGDEVQCIAESPIPGVGTSELLFLISVDDSPEGVTHIATQPSPYYIDAAGFTRHPQPPSRLPQDSALRQQLANRPVDSVTAELLQILPSVVPTTTIHQTGTTAPAVD